jgi:pimeloyl-ACP methyl ester carboxylesterase
MTSFGVRYRTETIECDPVFRAGRRVQAEVRKLFEIDAVRWQYVDGVPGDRLDRLEPEAWTAGAQAYARDLPDAEIHLLDTGHFALESHGEEIAALVRSFLARAL